MQTILTQIAELSAFDWITTVLALIYVGLAAINNPWCWVFGAVGCAMWAYVDVVQYDLYSDAALQVFYVVMSGIGIYHWQFGGKQEEELPIRSMRIRDHIYMIGGATVSGVLLGYFVSNNLAAAATYPDAITSTFSVGATIFLLQRKLENWLYWIVIDIVYVGIFWSREAWLFAFIMVVYVLVAAWGYWNWRKLMQETYV